MVQEYRAKYNGISMILEENPKILDIAHRDFCETLSNSAYGRGGYTSEQILRSIVVIVHRGEELPRCGHIDREQRFFEEFREAWQQDHDGFHLSVQGVYGLIGRDVEGNQ